jgi:hypothetical protein
LRQQSQTEIEEPGPAGGVHEDVRGLEVAVDHTAGVGIIDHPSDLSHDLGGNSRGGPLRANDIGKSLAGNVLEDNKRPATVNIDIEHPDESGVVELSQDAAFLGESPLRFRCQAACRPLDDHVAAEDRMDRPIDRPLRPTSEIRDDPVLTDEVGESRRLGCGGCIWLDNRLGEGRLVGGTVSRPAEHIAR